MEKETQAIGDIWCKMFNGLVALLQDNFICLNENKWKWNPIDTSQVVRLEKKIKDFLKDETNCLSLFQVLILPQGNSLQTFTPQSHPQSTSSPPTNFYLDSDEWS